MRITVPVIGFAAAALLLSGCSGSTDEATSPSPKASPTSTVEAQDSTAQPGVGNLDDALCAAAQDSIDTASQLQSTTGDLTDMLQDPAFLASDDPTSINAWGNDMLALSAKTLEFYELGVTETAGQDINADFVALSDFVNKYTQSLAQAAADAETPGAFVASIQDTFASDEVQAAASNAPAAAQNVATYLGTRCGITG